ncbi:MULTISPECIES: type II toxin-antitoxin system VapC family toxin [unclassified Tolypothrix]|uniref:type II toxin-antitoxin system VapC family toxin n=1 Tax=unclassified Tolypothrix TaxID=2649714 RepID=UPI0005EAC4C3|nr:MULTISPECIES: type II toxin-antitoxin system VapC family toxin [unclassified Tolypothrix]BAY92618.1 virulence associated protein C [Microchaete diplosiphon NIES-3275]EKF05708.1 toxin-antitoxin system, toxin component, PIN family [Tolypothrix sp. PCC 7601]MBE9084186.1 type II toxin-antitoxin system VapC family toxin [Tolypothrix sp. LEGE 11397]UYD26566.1 type II toxin-antitoxin system VapC family toxin [Tolypothrix sp. PCC 7712]UYD31197.1 type II toxin-antitoxin system VapC family toxin [Tol
MSGEIALDTSVAVRFLNGDRVVVSRVLALPEVVLPTVVVGELLFGAENSTRPLQNLPRYLEFIQTCVVVPLSQETATVYAKTRMALKRKGRPIPMNDVWIAAQCLEQAWVLVTDDTDFDYVDNLVLERW